MIRTLISTAAVALSVLTAAAADDGGRLVILHTNDTHSRIDPDDKGRGGILRRKVLVDSVRSIEPNVMLVDAGDAVQGTLYYSLFGGEVERKLMNALGYDIQILGNHEFDNGMEVLAREWSQLNAEKLSTNYDVRGTELDSIMKPYTVREFGGRRIGFLAINLDPEGMISAANSRGVVYLDGLKAANATAWHLRHNERCDLVVAITHIGYTNAPGYTDTDIAAGSEDIDIIIGGHTHTLVDPENPSTPTSRMVNAVGDTILVAQTGALGAWLGEIDIDLTTLKPEYKLITVDSRLDGRIDGETAAILDPYRHSVDSILGIKIGTVSAPLTKADWSLVNLITDFVALEGERLTGAPVDLAFMNRGGIRCDMPAGTLTQGLVMQMMPFDNRVVVLDISGRDLLASFDVMAGRGGDGVSDGVTAVIDPSTGRCTSVRINGKEIDPDRTYRLATIDYLALGGDYMSPLKNGHEVARSENILYKDAIDHFLRLKKSGKKVKSKPGARMTAKK